MSETFAALCSRASCQQKYTKTSRQFTVVISPTKMSSFELRIDEKVKINLDLLWLRDHCRCDLCYDHVHSNRKVSVLDIPDDVGFRSHEVESEHLLVVCEFSNQLTIDLLNLMAFQGPMAISPTTISNF